MAEAGKSITGRRTGEDAEPVAAALLEAGGFAVDELSAGCIRGWRFVSFNSWGVARPATT